MGTSLTHIFNELSAIAEIVQEHTINAVFDNLPPGVDEGAANLTQSYEMAALIAYAESGADMSQDPGALLLKQIAQIEEKVQEYEAREAIPNDGILDEFGDKIEDVAEFIVENSLTVATSAAGGPMAGVAVSAPKNYGSTILTEMRDAGYDVTDPNQIKAALQNPDFMEQAQQHAAIRTGIGAAVGASLVAVDSLASEVTKVPVVSEAIANLGPPMAGQAAFYVSEAFKNTAADITRSEITGAATEYGTNAIEDAVELMKDAGERMQQVAEQTVAELEAKPATFDTSVEASNEHNNSNLGTSTPMTLG